MTLAPLDRHEPDALRARAGEIVARDRWSREQLLELQQDPPPALLEHAVERSPYYREALGADAPDARSTRCRRCRSRS